MTHLGSQLSALADGRLAPAEAERALAHVAACPRCADELAAARLARAALAEAREAPAPDPALAARLLALRAAAPARPGDPFAGPPGVAPVGRVRGDLAGHPGRLWLGGSLVGVAAGAALLFVLGARPAVVPSDLPGATLALLGDAASVETVADRSVPDLDALRRAGWTVPDALPDGWAVTAARTTGAVLELDLAGPEGSSAVVSEQQGRLTDGTSPVEQVGGCSVEVLSYSPWTVVWQADGTVVQVVAASEDAATQALVDAFPAGAYDDGVPARIGRGWTVLTGLWS